MKKVMLAIVTVCFCLTGCAVTIPTGSYMAQNYVRYEHPSSVEISKFTYAPFVQDKVQKPNQIYNTAAGSVLISSDVSEFVRRATALEFEKTGIKIKDTANIQILGDILDFVIDDLGYSADISYSIKYSIKDKKSGKILYENTYAPTPIHAGKFGGPEAAVENFNNIVIAGYEMFVRDGKARAILDAGK